MCAVAIVWPRLASSAEICSVHPGFAEITSAAPESSTASAFRAPRARAASGCEQVVHAGRTAAGARVPQLHQFQVRDVAEQRPRLAGDPLRVPEVAGVVVGRPHRHRVPGRDRAELGEELRQVADPRRQRRRPGRHRRLGEVAEQPLVLLHRRPAPGGVDDDRVHLRRLERLDRPRGEPRRLRHPPGVQRQRPAAALLARDHDIAPLGREHPRGRRVDLREEHRLDAAGEHPDHRAPLPARRHPRGEPARRQRPGGRRREPQRRRGGGRQPAQRPEQPAAGQQPVRAGPLRRAQRRDGRPQPPRVREHGEDRLPRGAVPA